MQKKKKKTAVYLKGHLHFAAQQAVNMPNQQHIYHQLQKLLSPGSQPFFPCTS
jgi:hypothetical protein